MLNSMRKVIVQYQLLTGHYDFKNVDIDLKYLTRYYVYSPKHCLYYYKSTKLR